MKNMKASGYWTCYAILRRLCFFPRSYLFTDFLVLPQVTELVMHLNFPNYQNWNSSVLGQFFEISSLKEKYESIRLLNLLCYFAEIVLLSSQLFVHWFFTFASSYWTCYAFEFSKLSKLKFKCFGSFLWIFYFKWKIWKHQVTEPAMLFCGDCAFPRSYLFTDFLVLPQVTELVMHLNFPKYQNWNSSVLGQFFEISSLKEKYESIRLLNLLYYFL